MSNIDSIDLKFEKCIKSKLGCAVIFAGSGSDESHIEKIVSSLNDYTIPNTVRICSAHKQPNELMEHIKYFNGIDGSLVYIAVAGGTDALSGTLSYHTLHPVISCPPDGFNETCLKNPPGSSNAYIQRPDNVGKFIAQMYAGVNPKFKKLLKQQNAKKIRLLEEQDFELKNKY